jgi:hypothetical protein
MLAVYRLNHSAGMFPFKHADASTCAVLSAYLRPIKLISRWKVNRISIENRLRPALSLILLLLLSFQLSNAQTGQQPNARAALAKFVDSVAEMTYNFAWPTATYQGYKITDIKPMQSGFDVFVKLSGKSGLDDSNLWLLLSFAFRDGGLKKIRYDDSFEDGYTGQDYILERVAAILPPRCETSKQYRFTTDGKKIFLNSMN